MGTPQTLAISSQSDVEQARRTARSLSLTVGFSRQEAEVVVLVVSELSTNLVRYAHRGRLALTAVDQPRAGICVESHDDGPGIPDIRLAMQDGYSTSGGLGGGLPSVKRLMDDFEIRSSPKGTTIVAYKWLKS